jgi:sugar lactone lactonase YvrE
MNYAVADIANYRVLIYNTPFSTDESASVVLGQADFVSNSSLPISAKSVEPQAIAVDSYSNLYVSDYKTCRVLLFKPPFTNNMAASVVFGEPDFVTSGCNTTVSTFENVHAMAIDGDGDLWVADSSSRIMEFVPPFTNGMSATLIIGQANLTSEGCNKGLGAGSPTSSSICIPRGITFDSSGNLWVSDANNNRVLEFKPPFSTGMAASLELGQPSGATAFTSDTANNPSLSATTLSHPLQPAIDGDGNLWVSDGNNHRVLEFVPPFSNGMAASLELGQPSGASAFTTSGGHTTQSGFAYPHCISFDSSGNVYVVDANNSRVMIFDQPYSNGMTATLVLGQADFTHGTSNPGGVGATTLDRPVGGVTF